MNNNIINCKIANIFNNTKNEMKKRGIPNTPQNNAMLKLARF